MVLCADIVIARRGRDVRLPAVARLGHADDGDVGVPNGASRRLKRHLPMRDEIPAPEAARRIDHLPRPSPTVCTLQARSPASGSVRAGVMAAASRNQPAQPCLKFSSASSRPPRNMGLTSKLATLSGDASSDGSARVTTSGGLSDSVQSGAAQARRESPPGRCMRTGERTAHFWRLRPWRPASRGLAQRGPAAALPAGSHAPVRPAYFGWSKEALVSMTLHAANPTPDADRRGPLRPATSSPRSSTSTARSLLAGFSAAQHHPRGTSLAGRASAKHFAQTMVAATLFPAPPDRLPTVSCVEYDGAPARRARGPSSSRATPERRRCKHRAPRAADEITSRGARAGACAPAEGPPGRGRPAALPDRRLARLIEHKKAPCSQETW